MPEVSITTHLKKPWSGKVVVRTILSLLAITAGILLTAQPSEIKYIPAVIDFSAKISDWDGFGFNYVEAAQTRDYDQNPQDYGGFSLLDERQKKEIIDLVFGKDGLRVQIVKMFLDPWHQERPGGPYDHEKTVRQMKSFVGAGLKQTRQRGDDLGIITTLYGPPAWATCQKFIGGRDLDTAMADALCDYMIDWVKHLKEMDYPVKYLSIHNEGEDFYRWDFKEGTQRMERFDYNLYWPPEQVNAFLKLLGPKLEAAGLPGVGVTNGEPSNWTRFYQWNYTHTLLNDREALENLGLLTTHGFINPDFRKLSYGLANDLTTSILREKKPALHCWITSYSWGDMGTDFIKMAHEQIYSARVNALIPWAGIQHPSSWTDGDPNPGTAIRINDDGSYDVLKGYYHYKQLTIAGRRGMSVVKATLSNPVAWIIAFGENGSGNPDAFVLTSNTSLWKLPLKIEIIGTKSSAFKAWRSNEDGSELFEQLGIFEVKDGAIIYDPPRGSTTTFIATE